MLLALSVVCLFGAVFLATEVVSVRDYALPVTPRGLLVLNVWDKTLRPLLKDAVLKMPKGFRGLMMKLSGRSL